ncbi:MAG TPA: thioredoxin domain-containing protein, partial [Candidatus Nitrosotenuis sp.]
MVENNLIHETSPYLLQHAHNPVNWYAWNETALKKAVDENKPIFLSVGYSSCHWCHVMEHESFENDDIAEIMNQNFVSIKVDREERPDLDDIYQKVCQMTTGQGGWPLSVFLTPDQKPFYVGTYFPSLDSYGRPGFGSLLRQLAQAWKEKPNDVKKAAENFMETLQKTEKITTPSKLERSILDEAAMNLMQIADNTYGGFGGAPKFPNAANLSFILRYSKISKISKFSEFVFKTLNKMAKGGIFDQIGGGFHRYSTDARWLVPHFEKMLYDNALLPIVYSEAYQITKDPFYLEVIQKTLNFVLREMTS